MSELKYEHAPITEAVINLSFAEPLKIKTFDKIRKSLKKNYAHDTPQKNIALSVSIDFDKVGKNEEELIRFSSRDMTEICVLMKSSLIISQLAPYKSWGPFIERLKRDYLIHKEEAGLLTVNRIGVRYINRIDIPIESAIVNEWEYLNVFPQYPSSLGTLDGYTMQQVSKLENIEATLIINSSVVPSPLAKHISIVLDQDIVKIINVPQKFEEIVSFLERVRVEKNRVFEACIKDKTREIIK